MTEEALLSWRHGETPLFSGWGSPCGVCGGWALSGPDLCLYYLLWSSLTTASITRTYEFRQTGRWAGRQVGRACISSASVVVDFLSVLVFFLRTDCVKPGCLHVSFECDALVCLLFCRSSRASGLLVSSLLFALRIFFFCLSFFLVLFVSTLFS